MKENTQQKPTPKSERVVVDELFESGFARILRARRIAGASPGDLGINTWGKEREDFLEAWRVEAFVGYSSGRRLREGNIFFIKDGTRLNGKYKPIPRDVAARIHLLLPWEESRRIARREIKREFAVISAVQMSPDSERLRERLVKRVEKKFAQNSPKGRKGRKP